MWQSHKVNRHFAGVAVVFFAGFAFLEVSFTIIVIVHFLIWKVIRISTTSLPEGGVNRLRVNVQLFTFPFSGHFYFILIPNKNKTIFAARIVPYCVGLLDHICPLCSAEPALSGAILTRKSLSTFYRVSVLQIIAFFVKTSVTFSSRPREKLRCMRLSHASEFYFDYSVIISRSRWPWSRAGRGP